MELRALITMDESDADFTPTPNTSSNLTSLFGFTKQPLQGNLSLTYTAPKAPKSPAKKPPGEKSKATINFSKVVQAYKLENGNYVSQGVTGIVISSSHESHIYDIILYKPSKEHLSQTRISRSFSITLSPNNYASFYDNNKQNWSLLFSSSTDVEQFALKLAICKFYSSPDASYILIQDLTPLFEPRADEQNTVQITYRGYNLDQEEMLKIKEDIKGSIKISNCKFVPLRKGLVGCCENSKRVIIVPSSLSGHWSYEIKSNKNLLLEVSVEKVLSDSEINLGCTSLGPVLSEDGRESQKANLISRMAHMGQISLPVKQNLSAVPSDSEEESSVTISSPKPRMARNRTTAGSQSHHMQRPEPTQLVTVCQNDIVYHSGINKPGVAYQQLIPVTASSMLSPSIDPNLSVESRIQAAELRMGMSKISEKLDLVWNKIQNMGNKESEMLTKPALLDSAGVLTSIQSLITENESLKAKVEEQKEKIEQQNDKLFQLFELNHKLLEQNTTSHDKQSLNESKLKTEVESLRLKEAELKTEYKEALEKIKILEGNMTKAEGANRALNRKLQELVEKMEQLKNCHEEEKMKELESLKEKLSKAWDVKTKLRDKLREVVAEKERLNSVIEVQKEEIESGSQEVKDSRMKKAEYERTVEELKKQISGEELKTESRVESLSKDVARLEEENKCLKEEIEKAMHENETKLKEVLEVLKNKFTDNKEYSSSEVVGAIENVFQEATNGNLKTENEARERCKETAVIPAPRTSLLGAGTEDKSPKDVVAEVKEPELETKGETENEKKESESRHKSYDQNWRMTKPPPLPLFDDEDEDYNWLN